MSVIPSKVLSAGTLDHFVSHKSVQAVKIDDVTLGIEGDAMIRIGSQNIVLNTTNKPKPAAGWYLIEYTDGYYSFSPPESFEAGYAKNERGSIGWAVKEMQNGAKVRRTGWNGKGMFLFLVPGSHFTVNRPPLLGIYPEGTEIDYHAHVDMRTATGEIVPWLCSQTDLLAADWEVAE